MAIAWCASNPHVSTVITGASSKEQVIENMGAIAIIPKIDAQLKQKIEAAVGKVRSDRAD
ncbi:hypothetical protein [Chamaesiphon sp. VAR_48_metabat_403]|uniref:hypothetical protein n=1 Tax=Chamaesiphon sp. VAR_48_metabat_403 TaxID=2964700 RepID=UPI00286E4575|nr:hypothetical protein [Chamaesiphon sp. VAR_48_metabat_403]